VVIEALLCVHVECGDGCNVQLEGSSNTYIYLLMAWVYLMPARAGSKLRLLDFAAPPLSTRSYVPRGNIVILAGRCCRGGSEPAFTCKGAASSFPVVASPYRASTVRLWTITYEPSNGKPNTPSDPITNGGAEKLDTAGGYAVSRRKVHVLLRSDATNNKQRGTHFCAPSSQRSFPLE
jgi:hypothetical protein